MDIISTFLNPIYRQITYLGPQQSYSNDNSIRMLCRKLMALALMPHDQVLNAFNDVKASDEETENRIQNLLSYFEQSWLNCINS